MLFPGFQALDAFAPLDAINVLSWTQPITLSLLSLTLDPVSRGSSPEILAAVEFIRAVYPSLSPLITVCTGSGLAARAGVLDGKRATTNKMAWSEITALGPRVAWVGRARWVRDGRVWSSSGVSAGIDVVFAWIGEVFGEEVADGIEYERKRDSGLDPFAEVYGLSA